MTWISLWGRWGKLRRAGKRRQSDLRQMEKPPCGGFSIEKLEARVGIEPTHKGFADLSLTTWVPRLWPLQPNFHAENTSRRGATGVRTENLERETGVEPATSPLARSRSTTELLPLVITFYSIGYALPI